MPKWNSTSLYQSAVQHMPAAVVHAGIQIPELKAIEVVCSFYQETDKLTQILMSISIYMSSARAFR